MITSSDNSKSQRGIAAGTLPPATGVPARSGSSRSQRLAKLPSHGLVLVVTGLFLSACHGPLLNPVGPVGDAQRTILINSLTVMLCVVVPTISATLFFAWWYRSANARADYQPGFVYSGKLELLIWSVPILVVLFLGGIAWIGSHQLDPAKPLDAKTKALEIQVVSLDWKWLFIYPEQNIATVNQLSIPAGIPVRFHITSSSVMNAFFIPPLGSMIYSMNGMATELNLQADRPGTYRGQSSHFSGDGFSSMHFDTTVLPPAEFEAWVQTARSGTGSALDAASYTELMRPSANVPAQTFGSVEQGLFEAIVSLKLPPGPGPQTDTPGPPPASPTKELQNVR